MIITTDKEYLEKKAAVLTNQIWVVKKEGISKKGASFIKLKVDERGIINRIKKKIGQNTELLSKVETLKTEVKKEVSRLKAKEVEASKNKFYNMANTHKITRICNSEFLEKLNDLF